MNSNNSIVEDDEKIFDGQVSIAPDVFKENILSNKVTSSLPESSNEKVVVKVYGLVGYTQYIDLQFSAHHVVPDNIFVFENKRYKIASVIEFEENKYGINAVSIEYNT